MTMKSIKAVALSLAVLGSLGAATLPASAQVGIGNRVGPPPPRYEVVPPPRSGYYWRAGYWYWTGYRYAWRPGAWILRPARYYHSVWVPGHYVRRPGGWFWVEGHWN